MRTILVLSFLLSFQVSLGQTEQVFLQQGEKYDAAMQEDAALESYRQVLRINPNNYTALWKASDLCSRVGARQATDQKKKAFYLAGKKYADMAIKANPNGADGYFAMSVAMGRLALMHSGKEKIKAVKDIKAYADKAIKLNPNHGNAWHVLGKWYFEISKLNYLEKTAVKLMFGGFEEASLDDAIKAFEKSKQLVPDLLLNYYELAKAYKDDGQKTKAIQYLKKLQTMPNKMYDDARVKIKAAALLKDLGG